jgi:hypothetical protein
MMKDLTKATQAFEVCIVEGQQDQPGGGKRNEVDYSIGKPPRFSFLRREKANNITSLRRE